MRKVQAFLYSGLFYCMLTKTNSSFLSLECTSLISLENNKNVKFTASSSSVGPGYPVLNDYNVWCAEDVNNEQFLKVDLGNYKF